MIKNILKDFVYNPVDRQLWAGPVVNSSSGPPDPKLHIFSLPRTTVSGLISRCGEKKTTVTSVVVMLIAKKIAVFIQITLASAVLFHTRFVDTQAMAPGTWVATSPVPLCFLHPTSSRHMERYLADL